MKDARRTRPCRSLSPAALLRHENLPFPAGYRDGRYWARTTPGASGWVMFPVFAGLG